MKKTTWLLSVLFFLLILPLIGRRAIAQSGGLTVSFSGCASPCVLPAAPDFATDVLGDPWYMNKLSDVTLDPAPLRFWMAGPNSPVGTLSSFNDAANGAVSQNGVANAIGGTWIPGGEGLMILHRGYYGFINPLRNGRQTPIDTSTYKKVSFKMRTNRKEGIAQPSVFWYRHPYLNPAAQGGEDYSNFVYNLGFDSSIGLPTAGANPPLAPPGSITGTGYQIYAGDLSQASDCSTGFTHQCLNPGHGSWTDSPVVSLEIAPINGGVTQDTQVAFDWVRLTTADNAPGAAMKTINWSSAGSGTSTITVADRGTPPTVLTVARLPSGTFSYNWNYGVLPPGTYTLTVTRTGVSPGVMTFRINNPPLTSVIDPSNTDGADFATVVRQDPWDMKEPKDIDNDVVSTADHLISKSFSPYGVNELVGVSDGLCVSNCGGGGAIPVGDPEVWLLANNTAVTPNRGVIDTTKYRFLTFNLQLDALYSLGNGSVGRVGWGYSTTSPWHVAVSEPFAVFPANNAYTIDLAALHVATDQGIEASQGFPQEWAAAVVNQLRIKPDEFAPGAGQGVQFHLANVKLTAMAAPTGSVFNIKFSAADADNDNLAVKLYYDTTRNPADGSHRVLITSGLTGVSTSYNWNTNGVPTGVYYIYAEAFDGIDTRGSYSTGPVNVSPPPSTPFMSLDAPGNGTTVGQKFTVSGWAVDTGAASGTGINSVAVWAYPNPGSGAPPILLGESAYGAARGDIATLFGNSQFTNSGFSLPVSGTLTPGPYQIVAFGFSTVANAFTAAASALMTVRPSAAMAIDSPSANSTVGRTVTFAGWAVDQAATTGTGGTGVDSVVVWAYPSNGGAAQFVGTAAYGSARPDIATLFGNSQFTNSGFTLTIPVSPAGIYRFVAFAHSTVSGAYNGVATSNVTVQQYDTAPFLSIDAPGWNATVTRPFTVSGWAVDKDALTGTGIDQIAVWAYPTSGGIPSFVAFGVYGASRPDIGTLFGNARFSPSGFTLSVTPGMLPAGTYNLVVFGHSTMTNGYTAVGVAPVTVQ